MSAQAERLRGRLSDGERARANRFVFARDRARFVIGRGALRNILGRYVDRSASAIRFRYGAYGKPRLIDDNGVSFNLSHSGRYGLLAVALIPRIGIDLEKIRDIAEMSSLAKRCFSSGEQALISQGDHATRSERFFQIWTRKEACVKATGMGLSKELTDFECIPAYGSISLVRGAKDSGDAWIVMDLFPAPGYASALALPVAPPRTRFWTWSPEANEEPQGSGATNRAMEDPESMEGSSFPGREQCACPPPGRPMDADTTAVHTRVRLGRGRRYTPPTAVRGAKKIAIAGRPSCSKARTDHERAFREPRQTPRLRMPLTRRIARAGTGNWNWAPPAA